jgi:hypothetical protein
MRQLSSATEQKKPMNKAGREKLLQKRYRTETYTEQKHI